MSTPSKKAQAWPLFDRIIDDAKVDGEYTTPWVRNGDDARYEPDYLTLRRLLAVSLLLDANTQTNVPALALDVWLAYELRRAGLGPDSVWPRDSEPRVVSQDVVTFAHPDSNIAAMLKKDRVNAWKRLTSKTSYKGVTYQDARILGKNYTKQVDVVMSDWATGPEVLISTKRMDSSFGKNAANRVEEAYGDAKNLRLRHPMAALGYFFAVRSTIYDAKAQVGRVGIGDWLQDQVSRLGEEDDAYHATCFLVIDWGGDADDPDGEEVTVDDLPNDEEEGEDLPYVGAGELDARMTELSQFDVRLQLERTPSEMRPDVFLAKIVRRVLANTPVERHLTARLRLNPELFTV